MSFFDVITLLGGLAMFLYGMRIMGDGLKEFSSGPLKNALEKLTNTLPKAFFLGLTVTAVIQSSNATIVIASGLVGAGILTLRQSLGIIVGANVGTTVTGQIIRLLDLNPSGASFLQIFKPSTLAPVALIVGIILMMGFSAKKTGKVGQIVIGFGILFSGLLNMTDAVGTLAESGIIESLFSTLGDNPLLAYLIGIGIAIVLQSASASVGILQAFSMSGQLTFGAIYAVLVGIYLGAAVTTAVVCFIGSKPDAKRVGLVNIFFNLGKTVLILAGILLLHAFGLLGGLWDKPIYSGGIANANTIFNLASAVLLFPLLRPFESLSRRLVRDKAADADAPDPMLLDELSPVFFSTPALAFASCFDALTAMYDLSRTNIRRAFDVTAKYDAAVIEKVQTDEAYIDQMADRISHYLTQVSAHLTAAEDLETMNQYYSAANEFERLSDHAVNITEIADALHQNQAAFSKDALAELDVLRELIERILDYSDRAFRLGEIASARHIEPLEEVVDDMVNALKENHLQRLRAQSCSVLTGTEFLNFLTEVERISDVCSNIGVAAIARSMPEIRSEIHDYVSTLHAGRDEAYNREYQQAHDRYFGLLEQQETP